MVGSFKSSKPMVRVTGHGSPSNNKDGMISWVEDTPWQVRVAHAGTQATGGTYSNRGNMNLELYLWDLIIYLGYIPV